MIDRAHLSGSLRPGCKTYRSEGKCTRQRLDAMAGFRHHSVYPLHEPRIAPVLAEAWENQSMSPTKQLMELRIYTVHPRKMSEFVELFDRLAMPVLLETLGTPVGVWTSVIGPLNQFIQLWAYNDLEDYDRRFRARENHPDFVRYLGAYLTATEPLLVSQETRLLRACEMKSFLPWGPPPALD